MLRELQSVDAFCHFRSVASSDDDDDDLLSLKSKSAPGVLGFIHTISLSSHFVLFRKFIRYNYEFFKGG